jgi:hypothetical protein
MSPARIACRIGAALGAAALVAASAGHIARADTSGRTGTWSIDGRYSTREIQLSLTYRDSHGSDEESNGVPFDLSKFPGLNAATFAASSADVRFKIVRDAGTFDCEGVFRNGLGSGVFTFVNSEAFAAALASRGLGAISDDDQFHLAMGGMTLATVDALRAQGVSGLSAHELVRLGDHGVDDRFIRDLAATGVKPGSVDDYVRLADHGVTPDFVAGLGRDGYHPSVDDLVRLCDHGVTLDFIARLKSHGYTPTVDDLIRLRDAGM